ncbi:unnamed protein product [Adineta steineri]|uniref:Uncharacterized protein n=1 Tax=Adineta steineri TaxID=433720 RepID=A0A815I712_9BILA|nr:unnamed protein product [Adineta steineri]CAF3730532.1 unnamed protein product [Adineta steineri]
MRRIAVFQFRTLRDFCELSQKLIKDNLQTFLQTEFVQTHLISEDQLLIQMGSFIADFVDMTPKTYFRILSFIQNITAQNLFLTGASITSLLPLFYHDSRLQSKKLPYPGINYTYADNSSCTCSSSTANTCMGLSTLNNDIVIGFKTGCYMVSALLNSTLEVFHNQTFINILTNSSNDFHKLNSSSSHDTVETIMKQMFITHWSNETSFKRYFNECAPNSCQYTITKSYEFVFIITILISLFGGISSTLRILIPLIITKVWPFLRKLISKRRNHRIQLSQTETKKTKYSMNDRRKQFFQFLKEKLIKLNLFQSAPPSTNETILLQQRYTTRLYLIMFFLLLIILFLFNSIKPQIIQVIKKSPTPDDFRHLEKDYSRTLRCPCSQITTEYKYLIEIKLTYYEICTSKFVSSDWINVEYNEGKIFLDDIRYQSKFYFQLLSTLCQMSKQTIEERLESFYRTQFLSHELVHSQSFQFQFQSIFNQFKKITLESFQHLLLSIKVNFQINQFNTQLNSEFVYDETHERINGIGIIFQTRWWSASSECPSSNYTSYGKCLCESKYLNADCSMNTVLRLNETNEIIIRGMSIGWFPYESILISTFECFYNETCFSKISSQINSTNHFSILNSSIDENSTIEYLANQLFIQSWSNKSLFAEYFNQCHPLTCEYQYETRFNFIFIFTIFLGLVGGLNIFFRLLSPLIIKSIYKLYHYIHQCKRNTQEQLTFVSHFRIFFKFITKTLIEINLFSPIPPSNHSKIIQRNRRTTRIYLIFLLTTFLILIFYITLKKETITIDVNNPTILQYKQLFNQYSHRLQCPCTHITIKRKMFITQFEPHYHEICSSIYTSSQFIEKIYHPFGTNGLMNDLRVSVVRNFGIISLLCELSKNMLNISLLSFDEIDFVTSNVIPYDVFDIRIKTILDEFKRKISREFIEIFQLIQILNHGNQLATIEKSNWKFILKYNLSHEIVRNTHVIPLLALPIQYNSSNCSCGIQSNCLSSQIFDHERIFPQLSKRNLGFQTGCENLNAIFQSNLNCFYDSACVDLLDIFFRTENSPQFTYSSSSISNTTIEQLFSQLFVIDWIENKSFERYFDKCQPEICQYSDYIQYNFLYIITFLIALFGGLTNGMHFLINCVSIIIYKIIDYRKKKIEIVPNSVQSDMIEVIPESSITIDQLNENSIEDQQNSKEILRDKILFISLTLLCVIAIIASITSLILTQNTKQQEQSIVTTPHTILNITTTTIRKSITQLTTSKICYKTFKYQDEIYLTERNPVALVMGDFNQDSYVDLAIANADSNSISILLGNGNATFQKQRTYSTGNRSNPQKLAVGDLNDDGLLDLVVVLNGTDEIVIFFGNTTNDLFDLPAYNLTNRYPHKNVSAIEIYDWNLDGFNDLLIGHYLNTESFLKQFNLLLNFGDGRHFLEFGTVVTDHLHNRSDIIGVLMTNFSRTSITDNMVIQFSNGTISILFKPKFDSIWEAKYIFEEDHDIMGFATEMIKGKFNDDPMDDLAVISTYSNKLQILYYMDEYQTHFTSHYFFKASYSTRWYPTSLTRLNFDDDKMNDIAILHCDRAITVFFSNEYGIIDRNYLSFEINVDSNDKTCPKLLKSVDLNQDDEDDLIFIDTEFNAVRVVLNSVCDD